MAEAKKRLGRGLDSLLSSTRLRDIEEPVDPVSALPTGNKEVITDRIEELLLDKINCNPHQPRQSWDDEKLFELAESIKVNGLIQPILVRPMGEGFQLIAGERRMRAMEMAGKKSIPAIIRDASEEQMVEWALIENIHRDDLSALERARAYKHYIESFSLSQKEAAEKLGEDRSTIANYMRLLELPEAITDYLNKGVLSMGHCRALLGLSKRDEQIDMAEKAISKNMSVRDLERAIKQYQQGGDDNRDTKKEKSANILELEKELMRGLGTKVSIKTSSKHGYRGSIIIDYYSLDDFDRIKEIIC